MRKYLPASVYAVPAGCRPQEDLPTDPGSSQWAGRGTKQ